MEEVARPHARLGLPKGRRVLKRRDFLRVQRDGAGAGTRSFVVVILPHARDPEGPSSSRLGIVASRKAGNAVARNRGKRLVREWFRLGYQDHEGMDIVVILRSGAPLLTLAQAQRELDNGLRRAIHKAMRGKHDSQANRSGRSG